MSSSLDCVWPVARSWAKARSGRRAEQAVWFVDIKGHAIHRYHEPSGAKRSLARAGPAGLHAADSRWRLHLPD